MRKMKILYLNLIVISSITLASTNAPIKVTFPSDCLAHEFYDSTLLKCESCALYDREEDSRYTRTNDSDNLIYRSSSDGFDCTCAPGYKRVGISITRSGFECVPCPSGTVTSDDEANCASCDQPEAFDNATKTCKCSDGLLVETQNGNKLVKKCFTCPSLSMRLNDDSFTACSPCHRSRIQGANATTCECSKEKNVLEGGICIPKSELIQSTGLLNTIRFDRMKDKGPSKSAFFSQYLQLASYDCRRLGNRTACQILANLCVLTHYAFKDREFGESGSPACTEYRKLMTSRSTASLQVRPKRAPWLYYESYETKAELRKNNVPNRFEVGSFLKILAFRFNAKGLLVDPSPLDPRELQLCKESFKSAFNGFVFANNYHQECQITAQEIWDEAKEDPDQVYFYDLYLQSNDEQFMYPMPVLNMNLLKNGQLVNYDEASEKWQLVRRFFFLDALTGIESFATEGPTVRGKRAKVVRYMKSFIIDISLRDMDEAGFIYPPLVTVEYDEITKEDLDDGREVTVTFTINYTMDQSSLERHMSITLAVFCSLSLLWALLKTWTWGKRAGKRGIDLEVLIKFLILTCGFIANVFFLTAIVFAIKIFFMYKHQSVLHTMLPTTDQEYSLWTYAIVGCCLKIVQLVHDIFIACTVDIFFIDWERPRLRPIEWPKSGKVKLVSEARPSTAIEESSLTSTSEQTTPATVEASSQSSPIKCPQVSIWRSCFVANEWLELFTYRRLSVQAHLFLVAFSLQTLDMERFARAVDSSNTDDLSRVPYSLTCRMAVATLVYMALVAFQLIFKMVLYERYFKNKVREFVDVCSVSNISVFAWVNKKYGYYIHGRSPHGYADVNMQEMHDLLTREENDLCSKRGLIPNTDQQTFQMSLPISLYEHIQRMRSALDPYSSSGRRRSQSLKSFSGFIQNVVSDKIVPTYLILNKFLSGFIDHNYKEFDYTVKDKSILESILDTEFNEGSDRGYFYNGKCLIFIIQLTS